MMSHWGFKLFTFPSNYISLDDYDPNISYNDCLQCTRYFQIAAQLKKSLNFDFSIIQRFDCSTRREANQQQFEVGRMKSDLKNDQL